MKDEKTVVSGDAAQGLRADARRNADSLLQAAMTVFTELGVDAPMRTIAAKAGVGVGTLYRHFPQRSDLIKAIILRDVNAQVDAASILALEHEPGEALSLWMGRLAEFVATKRDLGPALHSGDPAYQALPEFVHGQLVPALRRLLDAAADAGLIPRDVDAGELLNAGLRLAAPVGSGDKAQALRMIALLVDGLRYRSRPR